VSDALQQVGRLFLAPAPGSSSTTEAPRAFATRPEQSSVALLGPAAAVPPLAAALAGELRARTRSSCALVLIWRDRPPGRPRGRPGLPAARRLADRLCARDLAAVTAGRLVVVELPHDPRTALVAARRGWAACEVPSVLAVAGARPSAFEVLLAELSHVVVVDEGDDDRLLRLVQDGLGGTRDRVVAIPPLASGPARWLAEAGIGRLGSAASQLGREAVP